MVAVSQRGRERVCGSKQGNASLHTNCGYAGTLHHPLGVICGQSVTIVLISYTTSSDKKIRTNPSPLPRPPEQCWGTFQRMTSGQLCSWGEGVGFVRFFLSRVEGQRPVLSGFSDEYVQMSTTTARSRRSLHTPTGLHQGLLLLRNEPDARPCSGRSAET